MYRKMLDIILLNFLKIIKEGKRNINLFLYIK